MIELGLLRYDKSPDDIVDEYPPSLSRSVINQSLLGNGAYWFNVV